MSRDVIDPPAELLARPEILRALASGDWSTVLRVIQRETGSSQVAIATETGLSQSHISRLMSGRVTEPSIVTVRMLCDGLGIPRSFAGLLDRDQELATERRQLLGGALGVSGLALVGTADGDVPVEHANNERLLMVLSATYRRLEHRVSSRLLIAPAVAHLGLVRRLRARAGRSGPDARRLATITSETAGLAGWLYADLADRANARRQYQLAIREAKDTGHPLLPAYMQVSFGHFAVQSGDAVQGLRLLATARRDLPRSAPAIAGVWLDSVEAVALAQRQDQRALTLLDSAERRLAKAGGDEPVWPWLFRFDRPKLAGYRAAAESKLGRWLAAEVSFAVAAKASQSPKQRAVMQVEHARVLAARDRVEQACALALAALQTGHTYGSERVLRAVAAFRGDLGSDAMKLTAELDDRLHHVYTDDS